MKKHTLILLYNHFVINLRFLEHNVFLFQGQYTENCAVIFIRVFRKQGTFIIHFSQFEHLPPSSPLFKWGWQFSKLAVYGVGNKVRNIAFKMRRII